MVRSLIVYFMWNVLGESMLDLFLVLKRLEIVWVIKWSFNLIVYFKNRLGFVISGKYEGYLMWCF